METIIRKCPDAILICLSPLKTKVTSSYPNVSDENMERIRDIEKKICLALSVPYIDVANECGITTLYNWSTFMYDGVHPATPGYKRVGQYLIGKILELKFRII